ncbi:MAG: phage integrase SAM-like domain-containing protein, partial [Tannerella sp.]|nr:phage integrase SAM-like domain-containing protein [Tannerella sp.]
MEGFMLTRYNIKDIALREINYQFVIDFENYLRSDCGCGDNTTAKFMQYFRTIILTAKNIVWNWADHWTIKDYMIREFIGMREHISRGEQIDT